MHQKTRSPDRSIPAPPSQGTAPLSGFAIQYNKNSFGVAPPSPAALAQVMPAQLAPGQSHTGLIPLVVSGQPSEQGQYGVIQMAIKNNVKVRGPPPAPCPMPPVAEGRCEPGLLFPRRVRRPGIPRAGWAARQGRVPLSMEGHRGGATTRSLRAATQRRERGGRVPEAGGREHLLHRTAQAPRRRGPGVLLSQGAKRDGHARRARVPAGFRELHRHDEVDEFDVPPRSSQPPPPPPPPPHQPHSPRAPRGRHTLPLAKAIEGLLRAA